jgi:hypothetical protein
LDLDNEHLFAVYCIEHRFVVTPLLYPYGLRPNQPVTVKGVHDMQAASPLRRRPSPAVYRRRRLAVLLCVAGTATVAWFGLHQLTGLSGDGPLTVAGRPVSVDTQLVSRTVDVVQPGDTLWSLARRVQPYGDIRPLVTQLAAQRGGRPLQVGETVELPAQR